MSNQWNSGQFQTGLPSQGNQVTMFDPTQFQAPATHGGALSGKPRLHTRQQSGGAPVSQIAPLHAATQPSWSSWNTWDWNSESSSTQGEDQQQQSQQAQEQSQQAQQQSQQAQEQSQQTHQHTVSSGTEGGQFYSDNQYTNTWNQGWVVSSQPYSQPNQAYAPPDTGVSHQSQELHQQQQQQSQWVAPQQDGGTYGQGQYESSLYGQQHYANNPDSQQQSLQNQQTYVQQHYANNPASQLQQQSLQNPQTYDQQHYANNPALQLQQQSLQNQQTYGQQQEAGDQSQVYHQGHEQYQAHTDAGYSHLYGASTWLAPGGSTQWASGDRDQASQFTNATDAGLNAVSEQQQSYTLQNPASQSLSSPSNILYSNSNMTSSGAILQVYTAEDDDGTVSGFFGKDDEGETSLDSQRHGFSYNVPGLDNQGSSSLALSNPLAEAHRTSSEVGSASLSTFTASNSGADAGHMYSHTAKDVLLAQRERDGQNTSLGSTLVGGTSLDEQYQVDTSMHHSLDASTEFIQRQSRGELSTAYHNPPSLPLNTNIRPASPDGDHLGSSGSGTSGGSSGLTDWEIVPAQSESLTQPGHNISLGNNSDVVLDPRDGSASMSHSYKNVEHQVLQPQGSQAQNYITASSATAASSSSQNWDSLQDSSVYDTSTTAAHKSAQPSHETGGHLRGPSAVTAQPKGDYLLHPSQPTVQMQTAALISGNSNVPLPSVPQPDGATNPFRKDGGRSPRHAGSLQPVQSQNSSSNASLASRGAAHPAEYKTAAATSQNLDSQKLAGATTPTSAKTQLPSNSSFDDGNSSSKRDRELTVNAADISSTKSASFNVEDSSIASQQQHHSAFHPVARQQQTVSPSASSWDSSVRPTPNILLAPVVPLIIPAMNPYSVSAAQTGAHSTVTTSIASKVSGLGQLEPNQETNQTQSRAKDKKEERSREHREKERHHPRNEDDDKNRSFDSLDEIDAVPERHIKSYGKEQRQHKDTSSVQKYERRGEPDRHNPDKHSSRTNPSSNQYDRDDRYHYDRPASRTDRYSKDEDYRRHHDYYRDYKDDSVDERYDRPRSRHGYGYDSYSRNLDYYNEERERYYRYSKEKEARLARAYYDEYYGAKYAEYYKQLEQHQQHQQQLQLQEGRLSSQESDRSSSHSQSRGSTPAIGPSPGPEQYGSRDSRPASRTDYSRDYYSKGYAYEGYNTYYDGYGYDPYNYAYGYPGYSEYNQGSGQGRMTPPKYSYPHVKACFGPSGQLVKVLPNRPKDGQPAVVEVQDIQTILENCPEARELKVFPGPLARNTTHKKDVLLFCQEKARTCLENIDMVDRESAQLIWKFLELLIKQNGSAVGTDLSDLLLEGHEPSAYEFSLHGVRLSQSPQGLDTVPEGNSDDGSSARESPAVHVTSDRTVINSAEGETENWNDRFRHLLLYGRKKDALDCAMKNNLWGHALFLASKMDARTHANVMTRFVNSAMRMNDPLQTLYQLMSGRQPAAVTCVLDERWGDWRPHLAMILSNQSSKSDIHRKSISTLGDTLAAKGYLYASHFCYIMAEVSFGNYFNKTSKLVLIGSSHNLSVEEFATNEAIQCTEVYEFAQSLGNPTFCLPHLQIYKYLYACRLADYGMISEALFYCEVIANNIRQNPTWFQASFVKLVCQLSRKLQFADPQQQMPGDEVESQVWIQQLEEISRAFEYGLIQSLSGAVTQPGLSGPTAISEIGEHSQPGSGSSGDAGAATGVESGVPAGVVYGQQPQAHAVSSIGQDVSSITDQLQNLNIADQSQQQMYGQPHGYSQQQGYNQHQPEYSQHQQGYNQQDNTQLQQPQEYSLQQQYDYNHWQQQQQYGSQPGHSSSSLPQPSQGYGSHEEAQHQLPQRASVSTNELSEDDDDDDDDAGDNVLGGSAAGFDYFGNVGGQKVVAPPHRYRTTSGSSTGSIRRGRTMSGSSTGSVKAAPHKPPTQPAAGKGADKPGQQDTGGGGWFGGLFNKLKAKGKNEMILPDDKNPAIVWDPAKKKWMNADGTEEVDAPQPPPPKDTDLWGKPSATVSPPLGHGTQTTSSSAGSNKFSLKATGARNQYVDISNPKLTSESQNVFNAVPQAGSVVASSIVSTGGPQGYTQGSSNVSTGAPQSYTQGSSNVSTGAPQMYTQGSSNVSTGGPQMYTQGSSNVSTGAPQSYTQGSSNVSTGGPQGYTQGSSNVSTGAPQSYTQGSSNVSTGGPQMYTQGSSNVSTGGPQMYTQGSSNVSTGSPQMYPAVSGHTDSRNFDPGYREHSSSFNLANHSMDIAHSSAAAAVTTSQPTSSMPVLFNPTSLKSGTSTGTAPPTSTARPGLKYGQRRTYPK